MQLSRIAIAVIMFVASAGREVPGQTTVWSISDNGLPGFGDFVAFAGDIDGDSFADYMLTMRSDATGALLSLRRGSNNQERFLLSVPPIEDLDNVGDLDADGVADIGVLSRNSASNTIMLWLYSGATGVPITLPFAPHGVAIGVGLGALIESLGDINSDGHEDFAVAIAGGTALLPGQACPTAMPGFTQIFSGIDGSIVRTHAAAGAKAPYVLTRLTDISGDGVSEYAIGGIGEAMTPRMGPCPGRPSSNSTLEVFLGSTGAPLQLHIGPPLEGLGIESTADINLDGFPDILSQSRDLASSTPNDILNHIMSGFDGSSIFCFHARPAGQPVFGIYSAGDLDGDYAPEFWIVDTESIRVMSGANSDTVWSMPIDLSTSARSPVAHLGSLTRDAGHELIISHENPRRVMVLSPTILPSASIHSLAEGFGRPGMPPPEFSMIPGPTLGQTVTFRFSFGTPLAIGNLLWGPPIEPYYFPTGHPVTMDLSGSEVLRPLILDANGEWALPFYLQPGSAVIGNEVHMQCYSLSPTSPEGVEVTNGLYIRFGPPNY